MLRLITDKWLIKNDILFYLNNWKIKHYNFFGKKIRNNETIWLMISPTARALRFCCEDSVLKDALVQST